MEIVYRGAASEQSFMFWHQKPRRVLLLSKPIEMVLTSLTNTFLTAFYYYQNIIIDITTFIFATIEMVLTSLTNTFLTAFYYYQNIIIDITTFIFFGRRQNSCVRLFVALHFCAFKA